MEGQNCNSASDPASLMMEEGQSSNPASDPVSVMAENFKFTMGFGRRQIRDRDGKLWMIKPYHEGSQTRYVIVNDKGECCYLILKKNMTLHHRWNGYRGNRKDKKNKCISLKRASLINYRNDLRVTRCGNIESDLKIKGDWADRTICIFQGTKMVAEMKKMDDDQMRRMGAEDGFMVAVYSDETDAIVIPVFSIIEVMNTSSLDDHRHHNQQGGNRPRVGRLGHVAEIVEGIGQGLAGAGELSNLFEG